MADQRVKRLRARADEQLQESIRARAALEQLVWRRGVVAPAQAVREESGWEAVHPRMRWGDADQWATFKATFQVPAAWTEQPVRLVLPLGGQGMAYLDGHPWQGLDPNHQYLTLPPALCDGQSHTVIVEEYSAKGVTSPRAADELCEVGWCGLQLVDPEVLALGYDLLAGAETLRVLAAEDAVFEPLIEALLEAERLVDRRRPDSPAFAASAATARARLTERLGQLSAEYPSHVHVLAMGHAHIDTAWLWPLSQTRRKVARSWSTVLRLMERYPDYHFLCSQPQQYRWMEEDEPEIYAQIVERVREGRWEPAGAMWVEPDVNMPSGEALVRQFVYGQRYLRQHFGLQCGILWLPDVFGYSAALPQLMKGAGVHTFVTSKLSWNNTNRIPHDTFRWRGLDGSEVLTFFITAGVDFKAESWMADPDASLRNIATYNGHMTPHEVASAWQRYKDKAINDTVLYPFGWGDGGGGANEAMLETARRLADHPGMPRLRQGNADQFLKQLGERLRGDARTPVWDGELYLEYHRGTYTGQSGVKAGNRRGEHALHDAELWASWAALRGTDPSVWKPTLDQAWETLLLNQFHDILPGSSIGDVYLDQARDHARVVQLAASVRAEAQDSLTDDSAGDALTVFSSLPWPRRDLSLPPALLAGKSPLGPSGTALTSQQVTDLDGTERVLIGGLEVPAHGFTSLRMGPAVAGTAASPLAVSERRLENGFYLIDFDQAGRMARLYDRRAGREVLLPGQVGNRLQAFEDKPLDFDAWDIDNFYVDKGWEIDGVSEWRVIESGPLRAGIEIRREWDGSTIVQRILLYADHPRIEMQTRVDWHHHQVLLKAAFPLNVRAREARYECAFGWVPRPTHRNTSWEAAQFEVASHRWADLSEDGFGVSLLNDSKYGCDCLDSTLRLTLLKSGIDPDPQADQGTQFFTYALYPHGEGWTIADTVREAYALNLPVTARRGDAGTASSLATTSSKRAVIDTIKPAEDGDGLIVRVFDCTGGGAPADISFALPIASVRSVNLLEQDDAEAGSPEVSGSGMRFILPAFGVRSFRVHLQR